MKNTFGYFELSRYIMLLMLLFIANHALQAAVIRKYVDQSATGSANGNSWIDAYPDLEPALAYARNNPNDIVVVWIAEGVYKPSVDIGGTTTTGTSNFTFHIDAQVNLVGGFGGWETSLSQRVKYKHPTVLSGDINGDDIYHNNLASSRFPIENGTDNSYNILRISKDVGTELFFSQLTFTGGNADHPSTLSKRRGGAIWYAGFDNTVGSLHLSDCIFEYNSADDEGGAIEVYGRDRKADINISYCEFRYNMSANNGGAIGIDGIGQKSCFDINIKYTIFYKNKSSDDGGSLYFNSKNTGCIMGEITNCTFNQNNADGAGGGLYAVEDAQAFNSNLDIKNTILWDNVDDTGINSFTLKEFNLDIRFSIFPESIEDNKNIAADPMFRNANLGNLKLKKNSPGRDKGASTSTFGRDIEQVRKIYGTEIDMGAYEYLKCPSSKLIYVDSRYSSDLAATNDGLTPATAFRDLTKGLELACDCNGMAEIQVAHGTYIPSRNQYDLPDGRNNQFSVKGDVTIVGNAENPFYDSIYPPPFFPNTIISGDCLGNDDNSQSTQQDEIDNIHRLMSVTEESNYFEIRDIIFEKANGFSPSIFSDYGGGLSLNNYNSNCIRTVRGCTFRNNKGRLGSALYCGSEKDSSNILIQNCYIYKNAGPGPILNINNSSPKIDRCGIYNNKEGVGLFVYGTGSGHSQPLVSNCFFSNNQDPSNRVVDIDSEFGSSSATLVNCTFFSPRMSSIYARDNFGETSVTITNCTLEGINIVHDASPNTSIDVSYSALTDVVCPSNVNCGDTVLYATLPPVLDKGTHIDIDIPITDYAGQPRIMNNRIDFGALENEEPCTATLILDKSLPPFNGNTGLYGSWEANDSIIVKAGFVISDQLYLSLSAPNIQFESTFTKLNMSELELHSDGCSN